MSTQKEKNIASALLSLAARTDTTDSLKNINIPVLVLVGEDDKITPPEQAKKISAGIKNSVLSIIPNSGHFPNLENSSAFNLEIEKFIERLK
jgi:3-oxoadipate enol-lactonase